MYGFYQHVSKMAPGYSRSNFFQETLHALTHNPKHATRWIPLGPTLLPPKASFLKRGITTNCLLLRLRHFLPFLALGLWSELISENVYTPHNENPQCFWSLQKGDSKFRYLVFSQGRNRCCWRGRCLFRLWRLFLRCHHDHTKAVDITFAIQSCSFFSSSKGVILIRFPHHAMWISLLLCPLCAPEDPSSLDSMNCNFEYSNLSTE